MVGVHGSHVCTSCFLWAIITFSEKLYQPVLLSVIITVALTALLIYPYSHGLLQQKLPPVRLQKADPPADCHAGSCRAGGKARARKAVMHCKATIRFCFTGEKTETDGGQVIFSK